VTVADHWALLGIEPTDDKRAVKFAYTQRLKETDVDSDPSAFIRLREALEEALYWGTARPEWEEEDWEVDPEEWHEDLDFQVQFPSGSFLLTPNISEWHPPAPIAIDDALGRACAELDSLLYADEQPDPEQIAALGDEILSAPELVDVDRSAETEQWLAQLIPAAAPRSDPLLEPAIARFGWGRSTRDWRRDDEIEQALARREAIHFLARARGIHVQRVALSELRGPPRTRLEWFNLSLSKEVRDFLKLVDTQHPLALRDLNAESVDWWRNYLAGPHLPANFWAILLEVPLAITLFALVIADNSSGSAAAALPLFPASVLVTYVTILVFARLRVKVRQRADQFWMVDQSSPGVPVLVLAALALPPVTALAPDNNLVGLASGLLAVLLLLAKWWISLPRSGYGPFWGSGHLPAIAALCVLILPVAVSEQGFFKTLVPLAVLCLLGFWSFGEVQIWLAQRKRALLAICGASILCLAAGILAVRAVPDWPPQPWILVLTPVAIVAANLASSANMSPEWEWSLRLGAALLFISSDRFFDIDSFGSGLLIAVYTYGLASSLVKLALTAIQTFNPARAASP